MTTEAERGSIDRVERRLDDLFRLVGDVRERLSYIEGRSTHAVVDELKAELEAAKLRIAALEAEQNKHTGAMTATKTWGEWLHRLAPWGFAAALVVWNYFKPPV